MNIERLQAVRDAILNPPKGMQFNMEWVGRTTDCGTVGCICGFACADANPEMHPSLWDETRGAEALGLSYGTAIKLFYPPLKEEPYYKSITPAQAAATIDHLIATGEVVWAAP